MRFVGTRAGVVRFGLAVLAGLVSLSGCGVFGGSNVSYRPPFVPVEFSIDAKGQVSVTHGREVVTPWGTFGLEVQLTPEIRRRSDEGTLVVIKRETGGTPAQDVFTLAQRGASACLNGTFVLGAGRADTIELFALAGSVIRIVEAATAPDACREMQRGGPDQVIAGVDSWVAQLASLPDSAGPEVVERRRQDLSGEIGRPVVVVRSADFASLRSGWWMFYYAGNFPGGQAALAFCAREGRTADTECVGRWLSRDPGDRRYICHFPGASAQPSACVRRR